MPFLPDSELSKADDPLLVTSLMAKPLSSPVRSVRVLVPARRKMAGGETPNANVSKQMIGGSPAVIVIFPTAFSPFPCTYDNLMGGAIEKPWTRHKADATYA